MPAPDDLYTQVNQYLKAHAAEGMDGLCAFLRLPTVSTLPEHAADVRRGAEWLADELRQTGLRNVHLMETGGHPTVYGEHLEAPGRPTVLVYGHYDVQPADPLALWSSPPFSPEVRGDRIYARGAADDKGQVWMHVLAVRALLAVRGGLPVNLRFLIEGEEEVGSPGVCRLITQERDRLASDLVVVSDTAFFAPGVPSISCGLRGLCALELRVFGPSRDLHSGEYGGAVANPLHALSALLASLHDPDGRVAVAGFYDDVRPLPPADRAAFAQLPFDERAWLEAVGLSSGWGEPGYSALERTWARPTLEVNGMGGGFQGAGAKTIVPASAHAKLTCRLVPDQDPRRVADAVRAHLEAHCPPGVRLEVRVGEGSPASVVPADSPYVEAAGRALARSFGRAPVRTRTGGSIGVVPAFTRELGAPVVLLGFGLPDDCIHAPDESLDLENFRRGQEALAAYWLELGAQGPR